MTSVIYSDKILQNLKDIIFCLSNISCNKNNDKKNWAVTCNCGNAFIKSIIKDILYGRFKTLDNN